MAAQGANGGRRHAIDQHIGDHRTGQGAAAGGRVALAGGGQAVEQHVGRAGGDRVGAVAGDRAGSRVGCAGGGFTGHPYHSSLDFHLAAAVQARGEADLAFAALDFQQPFDGKCQAQRVVVAGQGNHPHFA
ncbi:hypothetical protein D3C84_932240 [compost metagenome]